MQALAKEAFTRWKEEVAVEKAKKRLAAAKKARLEAASSSKQTFLASKGVRAKAAAKRPLENDQAAQDNKSVTWFDFETWQQLTS